MSRQCPLISHVFRHFHRKKTMSLQKMVPISIGEFKTGREMPVDVYIKLSDDKYVLISKAGDKLQKERLHAYKDKDIHYLYMNSEDYMKFVRRNLELVGITMNKSGLGDDIKTKVLHQAASSVLSEIEDIGFSTNTFSHAKAVTECTISIVDTTMDLTNLLHSINQSSEKMYAHSVAVSAVSVMIGCAMKWELPATREKLALGGLLHDLGTKEMSPDLLCKTRADMTQDEQSLYETHPFRGVQILQSIGIVPDDIVSIVYEHHENSAGQGYPRRLRDYKMHPLAKVVALADTFCDLILISPFNQKARTALEAVEYIEGVLGQPFSRDTFKALKGLVASKNLKKKIA